MALQVTPLAEIAKQPNRPSGRLGSRIRSRPRGNPAQATRLLQIPLLPGGAVARLDLQLQAAADLTFAVETEAGG